MHAHLRQYLRPSPLPPLPTFLYRFRPLLWAAERTRAAAPAPRPPPRCRFRRRPPLPPPPPPPRPCPHPTVSSTRPPATRPARRRRRCRPETSLPPRPLRMALRPPPSTLSERTCSTRRLTFWICNNEKVDSDRFIRHCRLKSLLCSILSGAYLSPRGCVNPSSRLPLNTGAARVSRNLL